MSLTCIVAELGNCLMRVMVQFGNCLRKAMLEFCVIYESNDRAWQMYLMCVMAEFGKCV